MFGTTESLERRLVAVCGLNPTKANQVVSEMMDEWSTTVDEFVACRHEILRRQGWSNAEIYRQIETDLACARFRAPALSERQIRRRIYG